MTWHSTAIANEFLRRARRDGKQLTQMQVQKLVYIAHGWNLAISNEPLTEDGPQAWDYGPVFPGLWQALRKYGSEPITSLVKIGDFGAGIFREDRDNEVVVTLPPHVSELIDKIYSLYSNFHAFQLSAMTHQEGTPWHTVYMRQNQKKGEIATELIKEHFVELARRKTAS